MTIKIQDIAPLLADHFVDIESDAMTFDENNKLVADNAQRLGLYHKYLGLLHDSWFIKTNITADKFSITLNDFTTHVFSDVIVDKKKLKIDHDKLVFPIQLDFETTNLTFNTVDEEGNIKSIEPTTINEYLYEQIISIDKEKIEIGLVVWKDGIDDEQGQHILILLNVKNITLTELQGNAWKEIFGNTYDNYYKYFKTQLDTGRYLSDQSICYELYDEYEGQINS
ncbi:hypothetical protein EZJ43_16705 [Pedobacter changchengzhani]|uniref:Uncharacterized protein n=1 Tax=Pedobacter changchengzhani TaxID=2529274 RepID=A0A4R5MH27_9SPHI|nr:hypothetical protein [Pedobacter changchengzhani]TDG34814.1 hypothetical protein EZJ43_16705 [Pedobacter changchengzhani]